MSVQGNFGSEKFNYVKVEVEGCDLGEGESMSDEELINQSFNFVNLRGYPSLLGDETETVVSYSQDFTYFKVLDPGNTQSSNVFFMESIINLKDNILDIFDTEEFDVPIFEVSKRVDYSSVIPHNSRLAKREYISIFFRADSENRFYKREGYDLLTFLGDLGGLFDICMIMGMSLTSIFAGRMFTAALIRSAYRVQKYFRDSSQFYETTSRHKLTTESQSQSSSISSAQQAEAIEEANDEIDDEVRGIGGAVTAETRQQANNMSSTWRDTNTCTPTMMHV